MKALATLREIERITAKLLALLPTLFSDEVYKDLIYEREKLSGYKYSNHD